MSLRITAVSAAICGMGFTFSSNAPQSGVREVVKNELRLLPGLIVFGFDDECAEVFLEELRETVSTERRASGMHGVAALALDFSAE